MPQKPSKDALRAELLAARRALGPNQVEADSARQRLALEALGEDAGAVSLYVSRAGEPGTRQLIDALAAAGWRILLPIVSSGAAAPDWAWFEGWNATRQVWGGIQEPTGQRLGGAALASVETVIVPCLAVGLDGSRLGTGGGWYDRALLHRRPGSSIWALAREAEVLESIPHAAHDIPVDAVITETRFGSLPISDQAELAAGW